jgi:hypothetical protein
VWIASVLLRIGFKFSARSLLRIDQIGEREEMIGTNTPITSAPTTEPNVGTISYEYPKKY